MTLDETASAVIVLMRHAESTFNLDNRIQGHSFEAVLTPNGKKQAILAGAALGRMYCHFDRLYTSDLPRCLETAQPIAPYVSIKKEDIITDNKLREMYRDVWERRKPDEIPQWSEFQRQLNLGNDYCPQDVRLETYSEASQRISDCIMQLAQANIGRRALIISSGEINKVILSALLGHSLKKLLIEDRHNIAQPNCCINEIHYNQNGWKIVKMDDVSYMLS